jgi:hypothetical protein
VLNFWVQGCMLRGGAGMGYEMGVGSGVGRGRPGKGG